LNGDYRFCRIDGSVHHTETTLKGVPWETATLNHERFYTAYETGPETFQRQDREAPSYIGCRSPRKPNRPPRSWANGYGKRQSPRHLHNQRAILEAWRRSDCCAQGRVSAKRKSSLLCRKYQRSLLLRCGIPGSLG